ncbi:hypothetical protein G6039_15000 [Rhodococcus aetherivorans]|nr:hypothetical protein [Rhodococcus aetherivorans]
MPGLDLEAFWTSTPQLEHVREFARARRAGPLATLGVVLARCCVALEPHYALPPIVGGRVSTNLFVALVGPSGGGKGAAEGAARDAVRLEYGGSKDGLGEVEIETFPTGSGEGLARTYRSAKLEPDEPNDRSRALFSVPEVDKMTALTGRSGSTLLSEIRSLWMGERIGFNNAHASTKSVVAPHSYRAAMTVGVQPAKAGPLINDSDGGTTQRFVWLPTDDPGAPDAKPETPEPITVRIDPGWGLGKASAPKEGQTLNWAAAAAKAGRAEAVNLSVPTVAVEEIELHRLRTLRGDPDVNPLDGHAKLCQLKVAAALMVLHGRMEITEQDWDNAGTLMRVSNYTRSEVERVLLEQARRVNRARAHADSERASILEDVRAEKEIRRVREGVQRYLLKKGHGSTRELTKSLKSELRPHLELVLDEMVTEGFLTRTMDGQRSLYALAAAA